MVIGKKERPSVPHYLSPWSNPRGIKSGQDPWVSRELEVSPVDRVSILGLTSKEPDP